MKRSRRIHSRRSRKSRKSRHSHKSRHSPKSRTKGGCSISGKKKLSLISIKKSPKKDKKLRATFCKRSGSGSSRIIHVDFGAKGYSDFTIHKDSSRKQRYIRRHSAREDFNAPTSRGALSLWVLWNKKTVKDSIKDYKRRFKL